MHPYIHFPLYANKSSVGKFCRNELQSCTPFKYNLKPLGLTMLIRASFLGNGKTGFKFHTGSFWNEYMKGFAAPLLCFLLPFPEKLHLTQLQICRVRGPWRHSSLFVTTPNMKLYKRDIRVWEWGKVKCWKKVEVELEQWCDRCGVKSSSRIGLCGARNINWVIRDGNMGV